jgi:hypothetical protein
MQLEEQIFINTAIGTSNIQQHLYENPKSSIKPQQVPQNFSNTAIRTSNLQQHRCDNLKSSVTQP